MVSTATAERLARDLAAMRAIVQAALDVLAGQQRTIDALARQNLALREEVRRIIDVRLASGDGDPAR